MYDEIVSPAERKLWGAGVDHESFGELLRKAPAGDLTVRINSPGGNVDASLGIYNALLAERGKGRRVVCIVDGAAHSGASVIAMAGDEVHMAEASRMLVHHARMVAVGTAEDMRQAVQRLETAGEVLLAAYRQKTGLSDEALNALLNAETFLTPAAAQRLKFADKVLAAPVRPAPVAAAWSLDTLHHPLARAAMERATAIDTLTARMPPPPAAPQAKGTDMTEPEIDLVPKAELAAVQSEAASLKTQLAAAGPVLAFVAKLTGKDSATDQLVELASMQGRLASLPSAEQQRATERANLIAELERKQVPPTTIQALAAACDAAGGDLAVLRAGAAKLQPPRVYAPAGETQLAEPKGAGEIVLTPEIKANYRRCGLTDEAQMLEAEKSRRAARTNPATDDESDEE